MGLHALLTGSINHITIVVRADDPLDWLKDDHALEKPASSPRMNHSLSIVTCSDAEQGMSFSIRSGLQHMLSETPSVDAVLIALADQPFITSEMIHALVQEWLMRPELDFVASSSYDEMEGGMVLTPPALLAKSMFPALLALVGDSGARKLFHSPAFKGYGLAVVDESALFDVDSPADFMIAQKRYSGL